jgi:hypothetical protein
MLINGIPAALLALLSASLGALGAARMPDQHGGSDSLDAHRGHPVVAMVVDARRLGSVRRWAEELVPAFPAVHFLTVADVNEPRPVSVERVAEVLARRVPPEATVLIDMQRAWAAEFTLDTAQPNLVVFGAQGEVVARFRGRWSASLAADVRRTLDTLGSR